MSKDVYETAKVLSIGCNREDLKVKLILDYEKLYYACKSLKMEGKESSLMFQSYSSKLTYISYLFLYLYGLEITDFVNLKRNEENVIGRLNGRVDTDSFFNF
mgnify:CR=1 FL=1